MDATNVAIDHLSPRRQIAERPLQLRPSLTVGSRNVCLKLPDRHVDPIQLGGDVAFEAISLSDLRQPALVRGELSLVLLRALLRLRRLLLGDVPLALEPTDRRARGFDRRVLDVAGRDRGRRVRPVLAPAPGSQRHQGEAADGSPRPDSNAPDHL